MGGMYTDEAVAKARSLLDGCENDDSQDRLRIVEEIVQLRSSCDAPALARLHAIAIGNAAVVTTDTERALRLCDEIREIRIKNRNADIVPVEAWTLAFVGSALTNVTRLSAIASKISALREVIDLDGSDAKASTRQIAISEARVLAVQAHLVSTTAEALKIAARIRGIYRECPDESTARWEASAVVSAIEKVDAAEQSAEWSQKQCSRISDMRHDHDTDPIALGECIALRIMAEKSLTSSKRREIAALISDIRNSHDTPEIAVQEAWTLRASAMDDEDARACLQAADSIRELRNTHDLVPIAEAEIRTLLNATTTGLDTNEQQQVLARMRDLSISLDSEAGYTTLAKALANVCGNTWNLGVCLSSLSEIHRLQSRHANVEMEQAREVVGSLVSGIRAAQESDDNPDGVDTESPDNSMQWASSEAPRAGRNTPPQTSRPKPFYYPLHPAVVDAIKPYGGALPPYFGR